MAANMIVMNPYKQIEKEAFHIHTCRCKHAGDEPDEAYVQKAIELGAPRIVFTDHCPFPGNRFRNRMDMEELPEYIESMNGLKEKFADKIEILCGLEVDYLPSYAAYYRMLAEMPGLDLLILGQHFYENPDGRPSYEDEDRSHEAPGLCEAILQGMETGLFSVLAHPDRAFKRGKIYGDLERAYSERIIRTALWYGICLEQNYSSILRRDPKRVNSIEERPKHRLVAEDEAGYLNHQLDIEEQLGIVVGSDGEFRNHVDDVSRIFIMQKDADGSDLMMDLKSAEIERESLEFWLQV